MLPNVFGRSMPGEEFINSSYPILIALLVGFFVGLRHYFKGSQCSKIDNLSGKVVVVTGASSGIGLELAREFAAAGAKVIMACRNKQKAEEAISDIRESVQEAQVKFIKLDLSSFASIRNFVEEFKSEESRLEILVNNAGILRHADSVTVDGNEIHFQVNYLGHFLLTNLLLDILKNTPGSRVVNNTAHSYKLAELNLTGLIGEADHDINFNIDHAYCNSSDAQHKINHVHSDGETKSVINSTGTGDDLPSDSKTEFEESTKVDKNIAKKEIGDSTKEKKEERVTSAVAYAQSKLAMIMFTKKLASSVESAPEVFVANPGVAKTDLYKNMAFKSNPVLAFALAPFLWFLMKTSKDGAQTALHCATSAEVKGLSGSYLCDCRLSKLEPNALDGKQINLLWASSLKACSL